MAPFVFVANSRQLPASIQRAGTRTTSGSVSFTDTGAPAEHVVSATATVARPPAPARVTFGIPVVPGAMRALRRGRELVIESPVPRVVAYFAAFQQHLATTWRQHLVEWLRANGGFVQLGDRPPATDLLPADAVRTLIEAPTPAEHGWIFCGRWLFSDRGEDAAILGDAPRLLRWIDQTFTDLLPLWSSVYREAYKS